jgi:hypothetical protein
MAMTAREMVPYLESWCQIDDGLDENDFGALVGINVFNDTCEILTFGGLMRLVYTRRVEILDDIEFEEEDPTRWN